MKIIPFQYYGLNDVRTVDYRKYFKKRRFTRSAVFLGLVPPPFKPHKRSLEVIGRGGLTRLGRGTSETFSVNFQSVSFDGFTGKIRVCKLYE